LYDRTATKAKFANELGYYCAAELYEDISLDTFRRNSKDHAFGFDCIGNIAGCAFLKEKRDYYDDDVERIIDSNARMRLVALLFRARSLHAKDAGYCLSKENLAKIVRELGLGRRDVVFDGNALSIVLRNQKFGKTKKQIWSVTTPGYLKCGAR
jgi:hypothetical protein